MGSEKFTIEECTQAAEIFGYSPEMVAAALKCAGKEKYTEAEARKIVKAFAKKEVTK